MSWKLLNFMRSRLRVIYLGCRRLVGPNLYHWQTYQGASGRCFRYTLYHQLSNCESGLVSQTINRHRRIPWHRQQVHGEGDRSTKHLNNKVGHGSSAMKLYCTRRSSPNYSTVSSRGAVVHIWFQPLQADIMSPESPSRTVYYPQRQELIPSSRCGLRAEATWVHSGFLRSQIFDPEGL